MTKINIEKKQKTLEKFKKLKEKGWKSYIIYNSFLISLGLAIGQLLVKRDIILLFLSFVISFPLVLLFNFFYWRELDDKIARIRKEIDSGVKIKAKTKKSHVILFFVILSLITFSKVYKSEIERFFYKRKMSDNSVKIFTLTNENGTISKLNIPSPYLQKQLLRISPLLPNINISSYPRISAVLPDLEPYFLTEEKYEMLKKFKSLGGDIMMQKSSSNTFYINDYVRIDPDYLSFSILPKNQDMTREEVLSVYDKAIKGGLKNAIQEENYGLTIYNGDMPYVFKRESNNNFYAFKKVSLIIPQDKNSLVNIFFCESNSCFFIAPIKNFYVIIIFSESRLDQWQELIKKVEKKINDFEVK